MLKIWNAANFRRTLAALCLIGAPLFFSASELLAPPGVEGNDIPAMLANLARYHDRQMQATMLEIAAAILFIPVFFGLMHLLSERGVVWGHIGGGIALLGDALILVMSGANLALWAITAPGVDLSAMLTPMNVFGSSPVVGVMFMAYYLFSIGFLLLGIGLWRSRTVPTWAPVCLMLAVLMDYVIGSFLGDSMIISVITDALLIVGLSGVAWHLLTIGDAGWTAMTAKVSTAQTSAPQVHATETL